MSAARYADTEVAGSARAAEHQPFYETDDQADAEISDLDVEPEIRTAAVNPRGYATATTRNGGR